MPLYKVEIVKAAQKEISELSKVYYSSIKAAILQLSEEPRSKHSKKLKGFEKTYRVRVGPYRIVYVIEDKIKVVTVTRVAHRKDVYD